MERGEIAGMRARVSRDGSYFRTVLVPADKTKAPFVLPALQFDEPYDAWMRSLPFLGVRTLRGLLGRDWVESDIPVEWRDHEWTPVAAPLRRPGKDLVTPKAIVVAFGLPALIVCAICIAPTFTVLSFLFMAAVLIGYAAYLLGYILQKGLDK